MKKKIIILLAVLLVNYLGYRVYSQINKNTKKITNSLSDELARTTIKIQQADEYFKQHKEMIGYTHFENSVASAYSKFTSETLKEILNANSLPVNKSIEIKRGLCNLDIENSSNILDVANSYICLAKLDELEGNIINSIKNLSYSNDILANPNNLADIAKLVIGDSKLASAEILKKMSLNPEGYSWVLESDEVTKNVLEEFTKSEDKNLAGRAAYVLSFRYLLGRVNANSERIPDLEKAALMQKLAITKLDIKQTKTTNIAFVFNEKYLPHAATTIVSMLLNSDLDNRYNFNVIYDGDDPISLEAQNKLASLSKIRDFEIKFIPYPEELIIKNKKILALGSNGYPRLVYFKVLLEDVLKNINQVMVLDVDILVLRDLYQVANIKLEGYYLAASEDLYSISIPKSREKTCYGLSANYFNSGVMVHNLKLMREKNLGDKLLDTVSNTECHYDYADQDLINETIGNNFHYLSTKWNIIPSSYNKLYSNGFMPFIIHYAGDKPWGEKYMKKVENKEKVNEYVVLYYPYMEYAQSIILN